MPIIDSRTGIQVIDRDECLQLLADQQVGRLAVVQAGRPHILPVNYVLDGEGVVFRTAAGTKLEATTRAPVAFEVDAIEPGTRSGWSVVVHGLAQEVTRLDRPDLQRRLAALPLDPWAPGDKPHLVRIAPSSITGRRLSPCR
jgi:uncharacterized protein